ncbi:hypothetical protein K7X08_017342 [Anisodus acutangulus]|uniref:Uncharacterized protein n=1 Tax=Anisodus acutangulus TaxID=402998 RepID=A0A9Q1LX54_9SOLA|nr:hypothetical protein K7X08_017342 [Anisodus acutangulus]
MYQQYKSYILQYQWLEQFYITLNTRLDSTMVSTLLMHSETKIIFVDQQFLQLAQEALSLLATKLTEQPLLVVIISETSNNFNPTCGNSNTYEYESLLESGHKDFAIRRPVTEFDPISINYTSGTTSRHKGDVFSHRAVGGTNVCLRSASPEEIFESISLYKVTHVGGAPTVLNMIGNTPPCDRKPLPHKVKIMKGTYCLWKPEWDSLPSDERFTLKAGQGVQHLCVEEVAVRNSVTTEKVPADGVTMGEIMFRVNTVMSRYLKDVKAREEVFRGGWFHSGDLVVKHPDGYIEVKDRLKDIIISGGENISTVEVERTLYSHTHPAVLEAAVVARPDNHWGQTPCAFVKLKEGFDVSAQEINNSAVIICLVTWHPGQLYFRISQKLRLEKFRNLSQGRKQKPWAIFSERN